MWCSQRATAESVLRAAMERSSDPVDFSEACFIVTGGNSGVGFELVRTLSGVGRARAVVMACRSLERGEAAKRSILKEYPHANIKVSLLNLSSFESVQQFVAAYEADPELRDLPLKGLVLNAGLSPARWGLTRDGYEETFQVSHFSHFLLFKLLEKKLVQSSPSRVSITSSMVHQLHRRWDWPVEGTKGFWSDKPLASSWRPFPGIGWQPFTMYAHCKAANIVMAKEIGERGAAQGVSAAAVHPGGVASDIYKFRGLTWLLRLFTQLTMLNLPQGAAASMESIVSPVPAEKGFAYFTPSRTVPFEARPSAHVCDAANQKRLWEESERVVAPFL